MGVFLIALPLIAGELFLSPALSATEYETPKVTEELTQDERKQTVREWIDEADGYMEERDYNRAAHLYEQVFLLDPDNIEASQKLDRLKKQLMEEGKSETQLVGHIYNTEIDSRTRSYRQQIQQFLEQGKIGQARLTLEKLLLLNPLDDEARKQYDALQKLAEPS